MSGRRAPIVQVRTDAPVPNTALWLSLGIAGCLEQGCAVEFETVLHSGGDEMILIVRHNGAEYVVQDRKLRDDREANTDLGVQVVRFCLSRHELDRVMDGAYVIRQEALDG